MTDMHPPRPTPARLRALNKKLDRLIMDIDLMTQGNVHSSDSVKLDGLRNTRVFLRGGQGVLKTLYPRDKT